MHIIATKYLLLRLKPLSLFLPCHGCCFFRVFILVTDQLLICSCQREEEERKQEERQKALEERLRFEQERMEQERKEQEEREKRYQEREQQIEEHR